MEDYQLKCEGNAPPPPPPPRFPLDQRKYRFRTHFREKRYFFQWEARIREITKRGHFLGMGMNPRNLKKGKILHVFISICFSCMVELLYINVLEL